MGFKCGIVGLPNVGKSTLFNALTNSNKAQAENFPFCTIDPNIGIVAVPDERLDKLAEISISKKKINTNTLNNILDQLNKIEEIDYMNIDVEGHEMSILNSFDIDKYKPFVLSVELIDFKMKKLELKYNNIEKSIEESLKCLEGTYGLAILFKEECDAIYIVRNGSPIIIAENDNYVMVTSEPVSYTHLTLPTKRIV